MYAIVRTGGKQYRVERGQTLLVERLPVDEGASCVLEPLLYVDGEHVLDSSQDGSAMRVEARVVAHERGPKLRVVKFKPKRGYRRRTGHRQELTRIEITAIETGERPRRARAKKDASEASGRSTSERKQSDRAASQRSQTGGARTRKASEGGQAQRGRTASTRSESTEAVEVAPDTAESTPEAAEAAPDTAETTPETVEESDGS